MNQIARTKEKNRRKIKRNSEPHTAAQRSRIVAAFREFIVQDDKRYEDRKATGRSETRWVSTKEFAELHGISKSTLYRWLGLERKAAVAAPLNFADVNQSIEVLRFESSTDWEFRAAAMNFSAWLLFPLKYFQRCSRTLSLAASHSSIEGDLQSFDSFPTEMRSATQRFLTAGLLRKLSSVDDSPLGDHEYCSLLDSGYTERDVLKSVGFRFMHARENGEAVSINKIGALLEDGRLLEGLFLRPSLFASLWKSHASTIPFLCAEKTLDIDWHLECDRKLDERLEDLMRDRRKVSEFFRVARDYVDRFRRALDRRASQRIVMPELQDKS